MPSKTEKQRKAMQAAAHGYKSLALTALEQSIMWIVKELTS